MGRPSILPLLCAVVLGAFAPAPAAAAPGKSAPVRTAHAHAPQGRTAHLEKPRLGGVSLGSPTDGRLLGGARLEESAALRIAPAYASSDVRWGLGGLVGAIQRAAKTVRRLYPDSRLNVGHLSRPGGGDVDRHASHESGRDADIGFYVKSITGKPLLSDHFVPFRGDGTAPSWPGALFDDARNWVLLTQLVTDPAVRVTHIFVAAPLKARLLAYAAKIGVPYTLRVKVAEVMAQPRGALPHDDHFHVRVGCPGGMTGCIELATAKDRIARRAHGARGPRVAGGPARSDHTRGRPSAPSAPATPSSGAASAVSVGGAPRRARPLPPEPLPPRPIPALPPAGAEPPPAHPPADTPPFTPPAVLVEPIDDVDGTLWGDGDPPEDSP